MGIVSSRDDDEQRQESASSGQLIDWDPADVDAVNVFYDLSEWSFDQRGELSEILADKEYPHDWEGDELVVPELIESEMDAIFAELEERFGPFAIPLDPEEESTEFGLEEWSDSDRSILTTSLVSAEIPHRWDGTTVFVARDAEPAVDELLDSIEAGELLSVSEDGATDPPDGILNTLFSASAELASDPLDLRSRNELLDLVGQLDRRYPPYAFAQRTWSIALDHFEAIVALISADGDGGIGLDEDDDDGLVRRADELRTLLRPFV